jgi:hypothetical protein
MRAGVNGWIGDRKDYLKIWATLKAPDSEVFTLVWESKELLALNNAIASFMAQQAYQEIAKLTITHFFYTGLVAAFATPWLLVSFSQACPSLPACLLAWGPSWSLYFRSLQSVKEQTCKSPCRPFRRLLRRTCLGTSHDYQVVLIAW